MDIGSKVRMNKFSNFNGEIGTIVKMSYSKKSFIIKLESGLVINAPVELIDFNHIN